jgi:ATP-dependent DNA helicase RecG
VYDDKLSIWNEGGLPYGLTLEELKGEHNSRPRNPKIAKACVMAGYIDTWGRGTLKIYNSCKEHGLPEPAILEKDGGFMVALNKAVQVIDEGGAIGGAIGSTIEQFVTEFGTLASRKMADSEKNKEILSNNSGLFLDYFRSIFGVNVERFGKEFGKGSGKVQERFRKGSGKSMPNWFLILELIAIYPNIIAEDISQIIGISERTVYKNFNALQEKKLTERVGGRKEGFWQILKQENEIN